jgi:hypothetical protein
MAEKLPEKKTPTTETKLTETKLAETKPTAVAEVPKISAAKQRELESAIASITKAYGEGAIMRLGSQVSRPIEVIPTGALAIDLALGVGGVPRGRVVEIYCPESSGGVIDGIYVRLGFEFSLSNSISMALFTFLMLLRFFTSTRLPNVVSPFNRIEILASHRILPSSMLPSHTSSQRSVLRNSDRNKKASSEL